MKKAYLCFILIIVLSLSACSKARIPRTDDIADPMLSSRTLDYLADKEVWHATHYIYKDADPNRYIEGSDIPPPPKRKLVEDVIEVSAPTPNLGTKQVTSSTGKVVTLQIPAPAHIKITNANGITVDLEEVAKLEELLNRIENNVSFSYIDLKTGLTMEAREDLVYPSASVIKAPFVKAVLESGADLEEGITYEERHYFTGSGILRYQPIGTVYKMKDIIKYTIEESDNVGYTMLCFRYGFDQFYLNAKKLGIVANQTAGMRFGYLTAREAALYFKDIYQYAQEGNVNGQLLVDHLIDASYTRLVKSALPQYDVAEKFGFMTADLIYHSASIVYSEEPYVMTIFTNLDEGYTTSDDLINEIAISINKIHDSRK